MLNGGCWAGRGYYVAKGKPRRARCGGSETLTRRRGGSHIRFGGGQDEQPQPSGLTPAIFIFHSPCAGSNIFRGAENLTGATDAKAVDPCDDGRHGPAY